MEMSRLGKIITAYVGIWSLLLSGSVFSVPNYYMPNYFTQNFGDGPPYTGGKTDPQQISVEWKCRITEDVTEGEYLTMLLGMDQVTRQSVMETLRANWDSGLQYHSSAYSTTGAASTWDASGRTMDITVQGLLRRFCTMPTAKPKRMRWRR